VRIYEWYCKLCNEIIQVEKYLDSPPQHKCGSWMVRRYSISTRRSMPEHFNASVGKYVSNENQFRDELKRASEEATLRTGMEHRFVPIDPREKASLGVSDEGMENTFRRQREAGQTESKLIL